MFTGLYITVLATALRNAAGDAIEAGWITFTPSSKFSLGGTQSSSSPIRRRIAAGALAEPLQLADPSQTSPVNIGYTIRIFDAATETIDTYANVALVAADDGTWNLDALNAGLYTRAVPYTLVQGPKGDPGDAAPPTVTLTATANISAYTAVSASLSGARQADSADVTKPAIGIASGAALANAPVPVQYSGPITYGWNWALGQPVFVGPNGVLTQTQPTSGFIQAVGMPLSPTTLLIDLEEAVPIT